MTRPSHVQFFVLALTCCWSLAACGDPSTTPSDVTPDASATLPSDVTPDDRGDAHGDATAAHALDVSPVDVTSTDAPPMADATIHAGDGGREDAGDGRTFVDGSALSREFLDLYDAFIGPRCGTCHGERSLVRTTLHMDDPVTAYNNLVNRSVRCHVPGGWREGQLRVAPGDPDASVLPAPIGVCDDRHTGTDQTLESNEQMRVRAWIANGAR